MPDRSSASCVKEKGKAVILRKCRQCFPLALFGFLVYYGCKWDYHESEKTMRTEHADLNRDGVLTGWMYFAVHFLIEFTTFYLMTAYLSDGAAWYIALFFDFFAFVPQGIYGYIRDMGAKLNFALLGTVLTTAALVMSAAALPPMTVILVLTLGNGMIHVEGAEATLRSSGGRIAPAALFVCGGSFGLIAGKLASWNGVPVFVVILTNLLMLAPILISARRVGGPGIRSAEGFDFQNRRVPAAAVAAAAVIVVAVRAYMGYGIPTSWNKTVPQTVALFCFMGVGKALGGVLTDRIGIRRTALISTLAALPFLIFGDTLMLVSLVGVMLFSMTMAVTLALIVSVMKRFPGVAFGLTTVGLFLGTFPVAIHRASSFLENCVIVAALTIVSALILLIICKKER